MQRILWQATSEETLTPTSSRPPYSPRHSHRSRRPSYHEHQTPARRRPRRRWPHCLLWPIVLFSDSTRSKDRHTSRHPLPQSSLPYLRLLHVESGTTLSESEESLTSRGWQFSGVLCSGSGVFDVYCQRRLMRRRWDQSCVRV